MKITTTTIALKNVNVELELTDGIPTRATHSVPSADLDDGTADGPYDGETFAFAGHTYQLGQHDYESGDGTTTCWANVYPIE